jgi:hypothetical protein
MWPLLVTNSPTIRPIQVGIATFITDAGTQVQLLLAAVTMDVGAIMRFRNWQPWVLHLEVDHDCARTHGIRSSVPRAIVWRGDYSLDPALQAEFLSACGLED